LLAAIIQQIMNVAGIYVISSAVERFSIRLSHIAGDFSAAVEMTIVVMSSEAETSPSVIG
jgi:hypothetical protein